jgi:hypothetical protein
MKNVFSILILLCICFIFSTYDGRAQEIGSPEMKMESSEMSRHQKIHAMMVWNLVDYLNLNEEQSLRFFPLLKEYDNARERIMHEHRELTEKISSDLNDASVQIPEIRKEIEKLDKMNEEQLKGKNEFFKKSAQILDERQCLKLRLYEDWLKINLMQRFKPGREGDNAEFEQRLRDGEKKYRKLMEKDKR